ncbi:MAG: cytochrome c oxidase subunit 3 [Pseudomonadota bacterium]
MNPFRLLAEKPWLRTPQMAGGHTVEVSQASLVPPQKVALRVFLGVVGVLFGLFFTAYFIRMGLADWRPIPEPQQLWLNTLLLFLGSISLQWTSHVLRRGDIRLVKIGLLLGSLFTFGFVFGQVAVWQRMTAEGYYLYSNPANSFFYVLTGVHALHILGGLWVWTRASVRVMAGAAPEKIRLSVELCATYWHFLLLVWLAVFALISYT